MKFQDVQIRMERIQQVSDYQKKSSGLVFYEISSTFGEILILHNDFNCSRAHQNAIFNEVLNFVWNYSTI